MTLVARTPVPIAFFDRTAAVCNWLEPRASLPLRGLAAQLATVRQTAA
jgi:hypothetical protein